MALPKYNLEGQVFGRLKVIKKDNPYRTPSGIPYAKWICQCECGHVVSVRQTHLLSGATMSCGCLSKEKQQMLHKKQNKYNIKSEYAEFYTTNNEIFLIDIEDVNRVKEYCWCIDSAGYVYCPLLKIRLHRYIFDCSKGEYIDHISGDKKDNRKSNLRVCTPKQNSHNKRHMSRNKTGTIGVHQNSRGKYIAQICIDGKTHHLGTFDNLQDAKNARIKAEKELYGEFSPYANG